MRARGRVGIPEACGWAWHVRHLAYVQEPMGERRDGPAQAESRRGRRLGSVRRMREVKVR